MKSRKIKCTILNTNKIYRNIVHLLYKVSGKLPAILRKVIADSKKRTKRLHNIDLEISRFRIIVTFMLKNRNLFIMIIIIIIYFTKMNRTIRL